MAGGVVAAGDPVTLRPLPGFGAEVRDVNLTALVASLAAGDGGASATGAWLGEALHRERLLVFRDQGALAWETQVAFSRLFGSGAVFNETRHANREPHPANPSDPGRDAIVFDVTSTCLRRPSPGLRNFRRLSCAENGSVEISADSRGTVPRSRPATRPKTTSF